MTAPAEALVDLGPVLRGQVLTSLRFAGLEVAEAGSQAAVIEARAERDAIATVLLDLLDDPCEAHYLLAWAAVGTGRTLGRCRPGRRARRWVEQALTVSREGG